MIACPLMGGCQPPQPVNTTPNGKSQTIKAQYQNTSVSNICKYTSTYGASGVAIKIKTMENFNE